MKASPYIISNWVEGPHFYGRTELCRTLTDTNERCVYLIGTRRIGKTSLLRRLAVLLHPYGLYCDLMQAAGQGAERDTLDEERLVRLLRRELTRQAAQSETFQRSRAVWDSQAASLCAWLEEVSWAWEERGVTVTLLWDEAEMLRRLPNATLMCLRALLQHSRSMRLVICASKGLAAINDRWRGDDVSPFLFGFRTHYISSLTDQEAEDLMCQRGRILVDPADAAAIRVFTGNHPFLLQCLCDRLYHDDALRQPAERDLLVDPMMADLFRIDVAQLSASEQRILGALAQHGPLSRSDLQPLVHLNDEALASFVQGMLHLGYLRTRSDGHLDVGNGFLASWLRSHSVQQATSVTDQASLEVVDAELQRLEMARATMRRREQEMQLEAGAHESVPPPAHAIPELIALRSEMARIEQALHARQQQTASSQVPAESLSEREREVLRLLAAGLHNPEIARMLTVSENTVKAHVKHIYRKLGVNDRVQAANRARELGLV